MNGHHRRPAIVVISLIAILCVQCAEIVPPPGGPEDRSAPTLINSMPESGALGVPSGREIVLQFSEPLVEPRTGRSVLIFPRPSSDPEINWRSDRIVITLPDSFLTDQTYIVSVSTSVADRRNNKLDSAVFIAFSTGDAIDSGSVAGRVFDEQNKPQSGAVVGLYSVDRLNETVPYDSLYPDYATTTGKDGNFTFQYLPNNEYRLIAFVDKNRDERLNPRSELFALPDRSVAIGGELRLDRLMMTMTKNDTSAADIIAASYTPDGLIKVRLSDPVELAYLQTHPEGFLLESADATHSAPALAFRESGLEKSNQLHVWFGPVEPGVYSLSLACDEARPTLRFDSMGITLIEDKTPPSIVSFKPDNKPMFLRDLTLEMTLSEPIDSTRITSQTFMLWSGDTQLVVTPSVADPLHVGFDASGIVPGGRYRFQVTEFDLVDHAGNLLGDSLTEYKFSILDSDSLGSLSGEVAIGLAGRTGNPVVLTFTGVGNKQQFDLTLSDSRFAMDLPAGKYVLSGYIDSDGDGKRGLGSLFPFREAETMAESSDTLNVRARFETAGVVFTID